MALRVAGAAAAASTCFFPGKKRRDNDPMILAGRDKRKTRNSVGSHQGLRRCHVALRRSPNYLAMDGEFQILEKRRGQCNCVRSSPNRSDCGGRSGAVIACNAASNEVGAAVDGISLEEANLREDRGEVARDLMAEGSAASNKATESDDSRTRFGQFRRRRLLSGCVAVALSSAYSSSNRARAGGENDFSFLKGSWLMGDSEAGPSEGGDQQNVGNADGSNGTGESSKKETEASDQASRVYDSSVLGEPALIGTADKDRVWNKLLTNRVIYLAEAEKIADADDKLLELEIVRNLRDRCFQQKRSISLALEAFPSLMQPQLNAYMNRKLTDENLRLVASHLPDNHWQEYLPLLQFCRDSGVRLIGCAAPLEVLQTIQGAGVQALSKVDRQNFIPPNQGGYKFKTSPLDNTGSSDGLPNSSTPFGPGPYRFAQSRIVEDYTMSKVITQIVNEGGAVGLLIVITGSSHVLYGPRGTGVPGWIAKNKDMQKRTQAVVLLNPERQRLRKEGDVPEADFLWYSAAKVCTRNCFDRAEVSRVMGAAGMRRDALPQDLQVGIKQGLIPPDVLRSFFEMEQNPILSELTRRFQGLRERWLADPRFLQRLAIEESISISTAVIAQFEERGGERFWKELDYVATDTIRGAVVDFFTVWLPAPRLAFRELDPNEKFNALDSFSGILGSFPDNAFQRPRNGENWGTGERVGGILVSGLKLFGVGFVSSVGTSLGTSIVLLSRRLLSSKDKPKPETKSSPVLKTALVYASYLGTSANLRYQIIAGVVEHWVADYWLASQPLLGGAISFVTRVANSYFGTAQWIDLARYTGVQKVGDDEKQTHAEDSVQKEPQTDALKPPADFASIPSSQSDDISGHSPKHTDKEKDPSLVQTPTYHGPGDD